MASTDIGITNFCTGQFLEQTMVHAHFLICYRAFVQYRGRDDIRHDRGNQRGYGTWKHSKGEVGAQIRSFTSGFFFNAAF